jgi:very-short-patch-repair endonuclease
VIAGRQDGIVTREQLLAAHVSPTAIRRGLRSGRVHRMHRGVYSAVAPGLLTEEGHLVAALLAAGDGALLSHGTAAWRWRIIPAPPSVITLAAPRHRAVEGVQLHVLGRLPRRHNPQRPLPHHHRRPHPPRPRRPLRPPRPPPGPSRGRVPARPAPGRRRASAAARPPALAAHAPGHGEAKSRLERRFRALLIRRGIELPLRNEPVGPWTVDCLWPDRRVVVELDGRQHERPRQADSDDDRDLWLRRNRYIARRYGARQVGGRPDDVVADLLGAFAEAVKLGYAAAGVPLRLL